MLSAAFVEGFRTLALGLWLCLAKPPPASAAASSSCLPHQTPRASLGGDVGVASHTSKNTPPLTDQHIPLSITPGPKTHSLPLQRERILIWSHIPDLTVALPVQFFSNVSFFFSSVANQAGSCFRSDQS
jgi:hypothetical protein